MRCKKHLPDLTSTIGVCASCLCERLQPLLAAQVKAQAQTQAQSDGDNNNKRHRKPKPKPEPEPEPELEQKPPPTLNFPRSVSPYVTYRKSDYDRRRERLFYGTPQGTAATCGGGTKKSSGGKFWILSNIFRGRSNKTEFSPHEDSRGGEEPPFSASPSSSWFSTILHARRHADTHTRQRTDRELSKLTTTEENCASSDETHDRSDSGNSSESSPAKQKPTAAVNRRSRLGLGGKGVTSRAFCLSPLVRASPNRHWSHKGLSQELGAGGTHHMSTATASFCANRSRKMTDFGRVAHNRRF